MCKEKTMRAAVLKAFHEPLVVEELPLPEPDPDEVLVKVMASGLCLTDVHIQEGIIKSVRLPYTPGHEMAGIVVKLGQMCRIKDFISVNMWCAALTLHVANVLCVAWVGRICA